MVVRNKVPKRVQVVPIVAHQEGVVHAIAAMVAIQHNRNLLRLRKVVIVNHPRLGLVPGTKMDGVEHNRVNICSTIHHHHHICGVRQVVHLLVGIGLIVVVLFFALLQIVYVKPYLIKVLVEVLERIKKIKIRGEVVTGVER